MRAEAPRLQGSRTCVTFPRGALRTGPVPPRLCSSATVGPAERELHRSH